MHRRRRSSDNAISTMNSNTTTNTNINSNSNIIAGSNGFPPASADYGPNPYVVNINEAAKQNDYFRSALWTGMHLQVTLMSIPVGGDIGVEIHPDVDQFLRIEQGEGMVMMGNSRDRLVYRRPVGDEYAIMVPAGIWHNIVNTGNRPLKLYSIYAPPHHPHGTVHITKEDAMASEEHS